MNVPEFLAWITAFGGLAAGVGALVTAFLTRRLVKTTLTAVEEAGRQTNATLVDKLVIEYKQPSFGKCLVLLSHLGRHDVDPWFAHYCGGGTDSENKRAEELNEARRVVHGYYSRISQLAELKLLPEQATIAFMKYPGAKTWQEIVCPMTKKIDSEERFCAVLEPVWVEHGQRMPLASPVAKEV